MNFNPRMKVNFDGGDLTSDAGLLLYKSFNHKLGFSKMVKELLVVNDNIRLKSNACLQSKAKTIAEE